MIYAAKTKATDNALTVGGNDGKLLNDILAFENKAEYQAKLDELWAKGDNLIRLTRKQVEGYMSRNFVVVDGIVFENSDAAEFAFPAECVPFDIKGFNESADGKAAWENFDRICK